MRCSGARGLAGRRRPLAGGARIHQSRTVCQGMFVMRLVSLVFASALSVCGLLPSLAQQPTGTTTLEDMASTAESSEAGGQHAAVRPQGTFVRPRNGVQHPDLDKAWAEYDAAVANVAESIKASIAKQFDAATDKGDLDAAEKWQAALENFEKDGELPTENDTKAAVSGAVADYKKAKDELAKAYEPVVKALTKEKKIAEAKVARSELAAITRRGDAAKPTKANKAVKRNPARKPWEDGRNWISLASTPEEFKNHWHQGDNRGSVLYDPKSSTINIDSPWDLGRLTFPNRWKEFYFEIATAKTSFGRLDMRINGVTFKLGPAAEQFPQGVPAIVKYDPETRNATVYFAGQPVAQATVLDDNWLSSFECVLSSNGGGNAKIALRELRLLSE